jgi:hypothetical protein
MKRILTIFLVLTILFVFAVPVYGTNTDSDNGKKTKTDNGEFSDVPKGHWAYEAIRWMVENKIVEGTGANMFQPSRQVTREEFAKMLVLTLDLSLVNPSQGSFLDIKKGGWQYKYIETAKPYLTGFRTSSGDYFHPSDPAVREDMAVALVKALGLSGETADLSLLSQFSDASQISENLKKYVAIAVKHKLIQGYEENGKRQFAPKEGLNRASAAVLLYNSLKEDEEKITYEDDEKVTYDDEDEDENEEDSDDEDDSDLISSNIKVSISGDRAIVSWDKITSSNFNGYKVVISRYDTTPTYPENGYYAYITDRNNTSVVIRAGDGYNGGDLDGKLKSGVSYYFSITVLYNNGKAAGNVVRVTMP